MIKPYILIAAIVFMAFNANAQSDSFNQLIKSSPADATKLIQNYAEPLFKGFGIGLNSGWNNTAKTKKFLHFDLRITANVTQIPVSGQSFDVTKIGLSNHLTVDPTSTTNFAPTFGGDKNAATPVMDIRDDNGNKIGTFNMPGGVIKYAPAPDIQLTVGIFKNTDITVRTSPTINIGNSGSIGMIGFGIKHDIIQDFVGKKGKKLIPFDLAIAVNYNRINYTTALTVQPDGTDQPASSTQPSDFSNQKIKGYFSGTNVQAIISKKLLFFTPFLSVGYQTANTNVSVLGNYPVSSSTGFYGVITDPVNINETSVSGFRTDVGFQLNLLLLRIFASYNPGKYQSANAGIGLGF